MLGSWSTYRRRGLLRSEYRTSPNRPMLNLVRLLGWSIRHGLGEFHRFSRSFRHSSCFSFSCFFQKSVSLLLSTIPANTYNKSPRWLVHRNRADEATSVLAKIYGRQEKDPIVQEQLQGIKDAVRREKENNLRRIGGYFELFRTRTNRKRSLLALSCSLCAMLTGSNIITYVTVIMRL